MKVEQERWLEAEVERLGPLEAIVRDLAGRDPLTDIDPDYGNWICLLCPDDWEEEGPYRLTAAEVPHHGDCPWRRAKEWVEAHP